MSSGGMPGQVDSTPVSRSITVRAPSPGTGSTVGGCRVQITYPRSNSASTGSHPYPRCSDSPRAQRAAISSASARVIAMNAPFHVRNEITGPRNVANPGIVTTFDGGEQKETTVADIADRDVNHALRERLADVYGRYERLRSDMDDLRERLASLQVSAASADGLVRATVGQRGELIDLELDRGVYRSHDPDDLARVVVATARSAAARTAEQ